METLLQQVRGVEHWVRHVLLQLYAQPGTTACEMPCVRGSEFGNFQRARISLYVGVDPSGQNLDEAKKRWKAKNEPFPADFVKLDPTQNNIKEKVTQQFALISCPGRLQQTWSDGPRAFNYLHNVATSLQDGGYFIGWTLDSSVIWTKAQKLRERTKSDGKRNKQRDLYVAQLYSIDFGRSKSSHFSTFGSKCTLQLTDCSPTSHFLVHFPTLIRMARRCGLDLVDITNFGDFYRDHRQLFGNALAKHQQPSSANTEMSANTTEVTTPTTPSVHMPIGKLRLSVEQVDFLELSTTFVFSKDVCCRDSFTTTRTSSAQCFLQFYIFVFVVCDFFGFVLIPTIISVSFNFFCHVIVTLVCSKISPCIGVPVTEQAFEAQQSLKERLFSSICTVY